jgi:hypothetical protein
MLCFRNNARRYQLAFKRPSSEKMWALFQKTFIWKDIGFISNETKKQPRVSNAQKTKGLAFVREDVAFILKDLRSEGRRIDFK